jgi:hypothetical protein
MRLRYANGCVGTAAVDHDDFIGEGNRFETLREACGCIEGNEGNTERWTSHVA